MIVGRKVGDVIQGPEKYMAFAINSDGHNDAGLAGNVSRNFWPELAATGPIGIGEILSKDIGRKVFYAMVVHSLDEGGWDQAPDQIEACFNELTVPTDEEIATVAMGAGMIGQLQGADAQANLAAMEHTAKRLVVYDFA